MPYIKSFEDLSDINLANTIFVARFDHVFFEIYGSEHLLKAIENNFKYLSPNHKYDVRFKAGLWNGKVSLFDRSGERNLFPIGLFTQLVEYLNKQSIDYYHEFKKSEYFGGEEDLDDNSLDSIQGVIFTDTYRLRDYQRDMVKLAISKKRCTIESATGSGKTITLYALMRIISQLVERKVMLIVPNIDLVLQTGTKFKEMGFTSFDTECELLYGKTTRSVSHSKKMLITTWQSIQTKPKEFFHDFDAVLVDEVHLGSGSAIQKILKQCVNAEYRIGVTGTLPQHELDKFMIFGMLGNLCYKKMAHELIADGTLCEMEIINVLCKFPQSIAKDIHHYGYDSEVELVENHKPLLGALDMIIGNRPLHQNHLVLCTHVEHLTEVYNYLKQKFPSHEVHCVYGKTKDREAIRQYVEVNESQIIVSNYQVFAVGIDIARLHNVIFFSSYKAKIKIIQAIGRSLRKHFSKTKSYIWDIIADIRHEKKNDDVFENILFRHWKIRCGHYDEQKYKHRVVNFKLKEL